MCSKNEIFQQYSTFITASLINANNDAVERILDNYSTSGFLTAKNFAMNLK